MELPKKQSRSIQWVRSLRLRLFLIVFLVGLVPLLIMRFGALQNYWNKAIDLRMDEVETQGIVIANHLTYNNYLNQQTSDVITARINQFAQACGGRVQIVNQDCKVLYDTQGLQANKTLLMQEVILCFRGDRSRVFDDESGYIVLAIPVYSLVTAGEERVVEGVMLASVSTEEIEARYLYLVRSTLLLATILWIVLLGMSLLVSDRLLRPFLKLTNSIRMVKDGFHEKVISVNDFTETEQISEAFNQLLTKMQGVDESRNEFVANVSHELKTPLTSMKLLADTLLMQESDNIAIYREFMRDIAGEVERENKIINDLLELVRLDPAEASLHIEVCDIHELLQAILKRLKPLAEEFSVDLILLAKRTVYAEVDEVKLVLAFTNLVENAIKYNREKGFVKITLDARSDVFTVKVRDNGIGILPEDVRHIYERFYRADKSHSRQIGGTGLGLAITKNVIYLHHGTITVDSKVEEGTTFRVQIPLRYRKDESL